MTNILTLTPHARNRFRFRGKLLLKILPLFILPVVFGCDRAPVAVDNQTATNNANMQPKANFSVVAEALPETAFRAQLTLVDPAKFPSTMHAGEHLNITVRVKNVSDHIWYARGQPGGAYQILLSGQWRDGAGKTAQTEEHRAALPTDLAPNQEVELNNYVTAPSAVGEYLLEIDMVQEMVSWFRFKHSTPLSYKVTIEK